MGLGKTGSAVVAYYGRGRAATTSTSCVAGSTLFRLLSTTTQSDSRTRRTCCCGRPPGVLYVDRGVIVLNKPPGLVSQGTTSSVAAATPVAAKSHDQKTSAATVTLPTTRRTAFDDVLDGTVATLFISSPKLLGWNRVSARCSSHLPYRRSPTDLWPRYKSVSGPSTRQGTVT
jgi:hypothetical protein